MPHGPNRIHEIQKGEMVVNMKRYAVGLLLVFVGSLLTVPALARIDWISYDSVLGWHTTTILEGGSYLSICPNTNRAVGGLYAARTDGGIDSIYWDAGTSKWTAAPIIRGTTYADICVSAYNVCPFGTRADGTGIDQVTYNGVQWVTASLVSGNFRSVGSVTDPGKSGCNAAFAAGGAAWVNYFGGWTTSTLLNAPTYADLCGDGNGTGQFYAARADGGIDWGHWPWTSTPLVNGNYVSVARNTSNAYQSSTGLYAARPGAVDWIHWPSAEIGWTATTLVTGADYIDICDDGTDDPVTHAVGNGTLYGLVYSDPVIPGGISDLKLVADGQPADVIGTVSAAWPDFFYVEDTDRTSGLRVEKTGYLATVGDAVEVTGSMATLESGERYIAANGVAPSAGTVLAPVFMTNKALGGTDFGNPSAGQGQIGVKDGTGLNNIGLFVKTCGKVSSTAGLDTIYIDDGSGVNLEAFDPLGFVGYSVLTGDYVQVTGISGCKKSGTDTVRRLLLVGY